MQEAAYMGNGRTQEFQQDTVRQPRDEQHQKLGTTLKLEGLREKAMSQIGFSVPYPTPTANQGLRLELMSM